MKKDLRKIKFARGQHAIINLAEDENVYVGLFHKWVNLGSSSHFGNDDNIYALIEVDTGKMTTAHYSAVKFID